MPVDELPRTTISASATTLLSRGGGAGGYAVRLAAAAPGVVTAGSGLALRKRPSDSAPFIDAPSSLSPQRPVRHDQGLADVTRSKLPASVRAATVRIRGDIVRVLVKRDPVKAH